MSRLHFLIILSSLLLLACGGPQSPEKQRLETLLRKMTLRQKIGQMFIAGVTGREINQDLKRAIAKDYLGGFFLAPVTNFSHVNEAAQLVNQFQQVSLASTEIPLFICARQEGGLRQALGRATGATDTPGNFALGVNAGFEDTYSIYRMMARELRAAGFNLTLAPLVNTFTGAPDETSQLRLFSANSALVAKLAQAAVRGFQQNGMLAAAGYFPEFSGFEPPATQSSGKPDSFSGFQAVISEDVSVITVTAPALDSPDWIRTQLRQKLAFKNLIISDDLSHEALASGKSAENLAVSAIQAGVDLIFQQTSDLTRIRQQIEAVFQAVETGQISHKQINASVHKILSLKTAYRLFETSIVDLTTIQKRVGTPESLQESLEISRRCVTIPRDSLKLLPLQKAASRKALLLTPDSLQCVKFWQESCFPDKNLRDLLGREIQEITELHFGATVSDSLAGLAAKMAVAADLVIFLTLATEPDSILKIVNAVRTTNTPMINLSVVPPKKFIPHISTCLVPGGVRRINLQAAVDVLFGRYSQTGSPTRTY